MEHVYDIYSIQEKLDNGKKYKLKHLDSEVEKEFIRQDVINLINYGRIINATYTKDKRIKILDGIDLVQERSNKMAQWLKKDGYELMDERYMSKTWRYTFRKYDNFDETDGCKVAYNEIVFQIQPHKRNKVAVVVKINVKTKLRNPDGEICFREIEWGPLDIRSNAAYKMLRVWIRVSYSIKEKDIKDIIDI